jgi:hypothetical protein
MIRNSEIESEGRVWRRCRPVGALSTLVPWKIQVLLELAFEISLVINF